MDGTTYQQLLNGVADYYGSGSDQWAQIAKYGVTSETIPIIEQVPGVTITKSTSGKFLGFDYSNPFPVGNNPASVVNSNLQTGAYGIGSFNAEIPATAIKNAETGATVMESGAVAVSTGSKVAAVASKVLLAVAAVSCSAKLGKTIDSAIYSVNPDWWDEHYPTINPETWDDMTDNKTGKNIIRSLFGLQGDNTTMYIDERMLAYTYMMLLENGAYSAGGEVTPPDNIYTIFPNTKVNKVYYSDVAGKYNDKFGDISILVENNKSPVYLGWLYINEYFNGPVSASLQPYDMGESLHNNVGPAKSVTHNGKTYYIKTSNYFSNTDDGQFYPLVSSISASGTLYFDIWGYCVLFGAEIGIDGVQNNPNATISINPDTLINPATGLPVTPQNNLSDVLQALKTQYPDLFDGSIYEDIPQPDGTTQRITYVSVPYPDTSNPEQPVTNPNPEVNPQTNPEVNPETYTQDLIQQLIDSITKNPTIPDTGEGNTPPIVIPTGTVNALYSVYNPTQSEINSFGGWLWSNNFVDQLLKMFNDPMQAIIGLHKVFASPVISGKSNIMVGYLDSGVSANNVVEQYTTIDCGTIALSEYFGNVFDYEPYTQVYIYLPFVGIQKLNTGDIMRSNLQVVYNVDVLTGSCLVEINVIRDGYTATLYTYSGDCSVHYPLSSGSYMGIIASLTSVIGGVVGTVASGGALAPLALGAVGGVLNAHTQVQHSGSFSGNYGAMGIKTPYLIIYRPQTCLADTFPALDGYPANKSTIISDCSGYIQCKSCHVENVPATDSELSEIENLLKSGIII